VANWCKWAIELPLLYHVIDEIEVSPRGGRKDAAMPKGARANFTLAAVQENNATLGDKRHEFVADVQAGEWSLTDAIAVAEKRHVSAQLGARALMTIVEERSKRLPGVVATGRKEQTP